MTARVLLAEDNEALAHMLERFLAAQGHEVMLAGNGTDALNILDANEIGLLVLDLRLPGLSGIELLQRLRRTPRGSAVPVVIMTGYYKGDKFAEAARQLGVRHYLEKPFTQQAFLQATSEAVSGRPPTHKEPVTLLATLVDLYYGRKSGILKVRKGPPVSVLHGVPLSFVSRGRGEFPAFLAARGKLARKDQQYFTESGEERLFLAQTGLLTHEDLLAESHHFLVRQLLEAVTQSAPIEFVPGIPDLELPLAPIQLPELLYEASVSYSLPFNADAFISRFGHLFPVRTAYFYKHSNLVAMNHDDIAVLSLVNGRRKLSELVGEASSKARGAAFCYFLLTMRFIGLNAAPSMEPDTHFHPRVLYNRPLEDGDHADGGQTERFEDLVAEISDSVELVVGNDGIAAPLSDAGISFERHVERDFAFIKDKNYYELFGMTPGSFTFNALKEAYFGHTRPYSQDRLMELGGSALEKAEEVLSAFSTAYNTLTNVVSKERYDELLNADTVGLNGRQDDKLQAQVQFQSGKVFIGMGEFSNAEKALNDAYRLEPDNPLHSAYLAWAIYRNPANQGVPTAQEKARTLLTRSMQAGREPEAFSFRGWMLLDEGRDGLADGEFQKALRINPRESLAIKGLQQIADRRQSEKKGLLSKIFG
jgi:CheY-like chemotaxis protein/curved DNA-binding protein CbpA